MAKVTLLQTNFTAGEISPRLLGRVDIARYANAVETMENFIPMIHGGAFTRWGTDFIAEVKDSTKKVRLIPYVFSTTQSYMLEFGHNYMRVYRNGAQVEASPGVAYEITTPYTEAMIDEIDFVQGADTMFIFHPAVAPTRLRRFDHNSWDMSSALFFETPFAEQGYSEAVALTLSNRTVGTGRTITAPSGIFVASDVGRAITHKAGVFNMTAIVSATELTGDVIVEFPSTALTSSEWVMTESPKTILTPTSAGPIGSAVTMNLTLDGWRAVDVGKYIKINGGIVKITAYGSPITVVGTIIAPLTGTVASPSNAWSLEASVWNVKNGYPRTGTLFEQRLIAASSPAYPQTVWGSRSGESLNFQLGTLDDDGFQFNIQSDQINPIAFMASAKTLLALTYGGEFTLQGGIEKPITPTNVQIRMRSNHGCANVRPLRINNEEVFIQRAGRKVRSFAYAVESDDYIATDLTVLAEHITESGIKAIAYQQEPESIIWAVRNDGVLSCMAFDRQQDVTGWARQITNGLYESVAVIPTATSEECYVAVKRTIDGEQKRYIEKFNTTHALDSAISGSNETATATWSGLEHLEGEAVSVLADGVYLGEFTVASGEITLPRPANDVVIGFKFNSTIEMLTPEIGGPTGSAQGNAMRVAEISLRLLNSIGGKVNGQPIKGKNFGEDVLDAPPEAFTGVLPIENLGWERGRAPVSITQEQPYPLTVLSVVRKMTIND
jgi:hypothetical protein